MYIVKNEERKEDKENRKEGREKKKGVKYERGRAAQGRKHCLIRGQGNHFSPTCLVSPLHTLWHLNSPAGNVARCRGAVGSYFLEVMTLPDPALILSPGLRSLLKPKVSPQMRAGEEDRSRSSRCCGLNCVPCKIHTLKPSP